jgi:hypothetical protein
LSREELACSIVPRWLAIEGKTDDVVVANIFVRCQPISCVRLGVSISRSMTILTCPGIFGQSRAMLIR